MKSSTGSRGCLPSPQPQPVPFERHGVIGFYYPDREESCDRLCGSSFLGNFYDLGPDRLLLEPPRAPGRLREFRCAEAAFQALKFWNRVHEFEGLTGTEAVARKRLLAAWEDEDRAYAGYGSNWNAMLAVLRKKFGGIPRLATALAQTKGAFLLEHNSVPGRDSLWSNNSDGTGKNWLGLQLMLVREEICGTMDYDWAGGGGLGVQLLHGNGRALSNGQPGHWWRHCHREEGGNGSSTGISLIIKWLVPRRSTKVLLHILLMVRRVPTALCFAKANSAYQ